MPIGERDYLINHPVDLTTWDTIGQTIGNSDKSETKFISISFDYETVKYQTTVHSTEDDNELVETPVYYIGYGTRSYNEAKKQLIKFLYNNDISCGIPQKEDFWNLICKGH